MTLIHDGAVATAQRDLDGSKLERVLYLLDSVDSRDRLATRILTTGNQEYSAAFFNAVVTGVVDQDALAVGRVEDASGFMVPYFADPTIVGARRQSALRQLARNEVIIGETWQGVVSHGGGLIATPAVKTSRVQAYVPINSADACAEVVLDVISDGRLCEEDSFVTGDGSFTMPSGVVGSLPAKSRIDGGPVSLGLLPEHFRPNASILVNKKTLPQLETLPTGVPVHYSSAIRLGDVLIGDFSQFLIVDRIGTDVEFVPALGADGKRGIYAIWSNGSTILNPDAFRLVTVA